MVRRPPAWPRRPPSRNWRCAIRWRKAQRAQVSNAEVLLARLPTLWKRFAEGMVLEQNAAEAARVVVDLPSESWSAFDQLLLEPAEALTRRSSG